MRKLIKQINWSLLLAVILLFVMVMPVSASDITGAQFKGIITVSNNGTAATNVCTNITNLSSASMIAGGYVSASNMTSWAMQNTSGTDVAFMPGYGSTAWMAYVPSIDASYYTSYLLYNNSINGTVRYFPGTAGMTTNDAAGLEMGGNFSIEAEGYFDTSSGANKYIVNKVGAFTIDAGSTTAGKITAGIYRVSNSLSAGGTYDLYTGAYTRVGQRIDSYPACNIKSVSFMLSKTGSPTGNITVRLRKVSDDSVIATLGTIDSAALTGAPTFYTLSGTWNNPASQNVRLCVEYGGGDAGNHPYVYYQGANVTLGQQTGYSGVWNDGAGDCAIYILDDEMELSATVASGEHDITTTLVPNYLTNSSFETGDPPDDYTYAGIGSWNRSTDTAKYGTYSCKINSVASDNYVTYDYAGYASLLGKTVTAGVWMWSNTPGTTYIFLSDGISSNVTYNTYSDSQWHFLSVSLTVDPSATTLFFRPFESNAAGGFYIDGAILSEGSSLPNQYNNFNLYVDSVLESGAAIDNNSSVADNANNYVCLQNSSMPYVEYFKMTIGGNLKQHISWQYAATLTDQSGLGNNPSSVSFASSSSDPDIQGTLTSFTPVDPSNAPDYSITSSANLISTTAAVSGNFSSGLTPTFPLSDIVIALATASSTPNQLPFFILSGFIILIASIVFSWSMKRFGQNSVFAKGILIFALMAICVAIDLYDLWMVFIFFLIAWALTMGSRHYSWGG